MFRKNKLIELYHKQDSTNRVFFDYHANRVVKGISRKYIYRNSAYETKVLVLIENPNALTPKLISIINKNFITEGINHFAEYGFPKL